MMTKTTLSDGRRTRPRFAAPTPTPPKFLIGTDDPARIGILPVLRREGSDQRESKGFGWDPAKTLRMAEPPEFLIGTDDPARIGILSDQRESKGFGWDPAKTLRMAEPPEFLIGTIDQSENHSTPLQTNAHTQILMDSERAFRIRRGASHFAESRDRDRYSVSYLLRSCTRARKRQGGDLSPP